MLRPAMLLALAACGDNAAPPDGPALPDLQFVPARMMTWTVDAQGFAGDSCEVVEGCVGGPGRRTLLHFATVTANTGGADLVIGRPPDAGVSDATFTWSPCHMHHHFRDYVTYRLDGAGGSIALTSKRAFCLEDDEAIRIGAAPNHYDCQNQGISRGWADAYLFDTACQFVDVTDVPPGHYTLVFEVNPDHTLPDARFDNNTFALEVDL